MSAAATNPSGKNTRRRRSPHLPRALWTWPSVLLVAAAERMTGLVDAELEPLDLTWRDWRLLRLVAALQPISQAELARRAGIDRTRASRIAADFRRRELLLDQADLWEGRTRDLYLAPQGIELLRDADELVRGVEARLFGHLDSDERADLVRRLQRMRF